MTIRNTQPIDREYVNGALGGVTDKHPCFGMINVRRVNGGGLPLFGSVVNHENGYVSLTISKCERNHSFSNDNYFGKDRLIEIAMTESQFVNFITNWNMGEGTPVTLKNIREGKSTQVPGLPIDHESAATRAENDFKETLASTMVAFDAKKKELLEVLDKKGTINKSDRAQIAGIITVLERWFKDATPYSMHTFVEGADKTINIAKAEIEAFVTRIINKTGLDALQSMGKLTGFSKDDHPALKGGE